ncbi:hypothetical protein [Escherichia phage BF17]|nr:hypothetical protein [Escherichia coli]ELW0836260.1 hypothetical protein [Escherichia coli]QXN76325.1 hypothetical protein [Escherichia phage BF17]WGM49581.1 hypothetical protein EcMJ_339 [Escherichia phage vB_Ec-M-J]
MLTVYIFKKEEYLKSQYSKIEINVPYGTLVGYDEASETLYYNDDRLDYSIDSFIEDILNSNTEDMLYEEYLDKYKERMSKLHADAPVLNISKTPSEFEPQNPFQRLIDAGVNFRIT